MFFELAFLFMIGSVGGWVIEVFFRRFFSLKKWINPGFLNGTYLPMYGCGTIILFGACFMPLPRWGITIFLVFGLTLLEYVTGLIFIKGMKIKLWDYSDRWGNIQGIICPLFSLFWGIIAAVFVYFLYEPLNTAAIWAAGNVWMLFFMGIFYGVFITDLCISFNVSLKIRNAAAQFRTAVHYEELKAAINERRKKSRQHIKFLFPFAGASFRDSVSDWLESRKEALQARVSRGRKHKNGGTDDDGDGGESEVSAQ